MIQTRLSRLLTIAVFCAICPVATAQSLFVPETFGDGIAASANGWSVGNSGGELADSGEDGAGDHVVNYGTTTGFHILHPVAGAAPNPVFLGDYTGIGATAIRFNARHSGIGDPVALRATLFLDFADGVDWVTSNDALEIPVSATDWTTYEIPLNATDLFAGGTNSPTVNDVLSEVAQVGLRHDPDGTGPTSQARVSELTNVYFDDITLVPEPSAFTLLIFGFGLVVCRKVRHKSSMCL